MSTVHLDTAVLPSRQVRQFNNDAQGIGQLVEWLTTVQPSGVVLEATGALEIPLAAELELAALPVSIVNPRQVRDFARAVGKLAKTDTIDALVLARFAQAVRPPRRPLPDAKARELRGLVDRRRQLIEMLTSERKGLSRNNLSSRERVRTLPQCAGARSGLKEWPSCYVTDP